ncbi:hypothetical protein BD324DRAFT_604686 [Kockovaella imperatae]|uniref:NmrA-like domain-containing protein n=1 Tax=Kockovaella imperatae TaxID=4999 RepID=A0A1Y1U8Y5_9TREE|nr:hypothetical protein BD324DRAFT_604686 [Kockovaella imperatae]ORX34493.1 hypothetical protein BD324DRAFT_604686 [Kockovaella imperatae]
MSKLLVILGATGNQGGSVIRSILADPQAKSQFSLRGITRDPSSAKSQKLSSQGVDLVKADLDDTESLKRAFEGAHGVFAVTDFWSLGDNAKERETQQGKNIGDAAKAAGVKHLVYSMLYNVNDATKGRLSKVYHFDSKADAADYIDSLGVPNTKFMPGYFLSNFVTGFNPNPQTGALTQFIPISPSSKVPIFDAEADTGKFVKAIFLKPDQTLGKHIKAATAYLTYDEIASTLAKLRPTKAKGASAVQIPRENFLQALEGRGMPQAIAEDLTQMFEFIENPGYFRGEQLSTDILDEPATTWEQFIEKTQQWNE